MIQLIGILIIVNTLVMSTWWLTTKQSWSSGFTTVSVLACLIGLVLVLNERAIELSFGPFGALKTAAQQAETDAKEISEIRKRVEAQAATMDLVAQKATATAGQLHNITLSSAEATITELMANAFMGGTTLETRLNLHDGIIASLRKIGIKEDEISKVNKMWTKGVGVIYHRSIRSALEGRTEPNHLNVKASPELRQASEEFQKLQDFSKWEVPSPNDMESFIDEKGFMNDTVKELIEDYRHFLKTGDIRRRDVFANL